MQFLGCWIWIYASVSGFTEKLAVFKDKENSEKIAFL